jgi:hypothetical protein
MRDGREQPLTRNSAARTSYKSPLTNHQSPFFVSGRRKRRTLRVTGCTYHSAFGNSAEVSSHQTNYHSSRSEHSLSGGLDELRVPLHAR